VCPRLNREFLPWRIVPAFAEHCCHCESLTGLWLEIDCLRRLFLQDLYPVNVVCCRGACMCDRYQEQEPTTGKGSTTINDRLS
jgi:hypothetical protein